jgi:hypothetical protein
VTAWLVTKKRKGDELCGGDAKRLKLAGEGSSRTGGNVRGRGCDRGRGNGKSRDGHPLHLLAIFFAIKNLQLALLAQIVFINMVSFFFHTLS